MRKKTCHKIDLRGFIVPFTLLKVSQVFRSLETGDSLEICWSDPDRSEDLFRILPESSYEILRIEERNETPFEFVVKLRKIASTRSPLTVRGAKSS